MRIFCKPSLIFRTIAILLLAGLPARLLPDFFHVAAFPLLSLAAIVGGYYASKTRFRLPVISIISAGIMGTFLLILASLAYLLPISGIHRMFLYTRLVFFPAALFFIFLATSTSAFLRYLKWRQTEPVILILTGVAFFWSQGNHSLTLFSHPYHAALGVFIFMVAVLAILFFSATSRKQPLAHLLVLLPLFLVCGTLFLATYNAQSVASSGGLIRPTLFRFDFSPFLRLQNEISLNNKLVCIVRVPKQYSRNFLRRVYLAGWDPEKGFYEMPVPGDVPQITTVPGISTTLPAESRLMREEVSQEIFIVNFDPDSLIAMDYPVHITPYAMWDQSSFNGAYRVTSQTTGFIPFELFDSPFPEPGVDLPHNAFKTYTEIDSATREMLEPLITSITGKFTGYYDTILLLNEFLRNGEYRYSLKPGQAAQGNQLQHFLFESRKGYCTYFAFSLCLMLRAKGIPSRVAAGFFLESDSAALDYYPVRSNMAHAWVEVFFPGYGWISFDPTTTQIASGEEIVMSDSAGGDDFIAFLNEIIDNRTFLLESVTAQEEPHSASRLSDIIRRMLPGTGPLLLLILVLLPVLVIIYSRLREKYILCYSRSNRRIILLCTHRVQRRLGGTRKKKHAWILPDTLPGATTDQIRQLRDLEKKARFAPVCSDEDAQTAHYLEKILSRKRLHTRFFAVLLFCLAFFCAFPSLDAQTGNTELLSRAESAISAENWEMAITALTQGITLYPEDPRFPYTLGTIYEREKLYKPAKKAYLAALSLGLSDTPELFEHLSSCYSYLNENESALEYLRTYLDLVPDDLYAWSNFGWLCYKTNKLEEGISTLVSTIEHYGPDGNLYVGLGNLYTSAFDYVNAKKYYTLAISYARENKQNFLGSIYLYNRSILEEIFYNFDEAYEDTARSLRAASRSSGYLMQGELELRRMEFSAALSRYQKAYSLDSTPLAALGLADTLVQAGYVDEAEPYLNAITKRKDLSWIANYGTTPEQFKSDIHRIQRDRYRILVSREKRHLVHNFSTAVYKWYRLAKLNVSLWYHDGLFKICNNKVGQFYKRGENPLYYNSFFFLSYDSWPSIARTYLDNAQKKEVSLIPQALPVYRYEQARITNDKNMYLDSVASLHPIWEKNYIAKALSGYLSLHRPVQTDSYRTSQTYAYSIQPVSFLLNDLSFPVQHTFSGLSKKEQHLVSRCLTKAGFIEDPHAPFSVYIQGTKNDLSITLINAQKRTIYTQVIHKTGRFLPACTSQINSLVQKLFRTELGL